MKRTVVHIIGTSFSGSSLLNLLLDAQPGVRGLGEAVNLCREIVDTACTLCTGPLQDCPMYRAVDRGRFYASLFDFYADCDILIDSSKSITACFASHAFEPEFEHKVLLLSKSPHEFAYSWMGHHPDQTLEEAFQVYLDFYANHLNLFSWGHWLEPWQCLRITYRQMTTRTELTLRQLSAFLEIPFGTWPSWQTDTHIVGGNWMVAAQTQGRQNLFRETDWYLGGKYVDRYHTIFYDNQWHRDRRFVERCLDIYRCLELELAPLLKSLGQLDIRQQVSDLENPFSIS